MGLLLHLAFTWVLRRERGTSCVYTEHFLTQLCPWLLSLVCSYSDEYYFNHYGNKLILSYEELIEMSIIKNPF